MCLCVSVCVCGYVCQRVSLSQIKKDGEKRVREKERERERERERGGGGMEAHEGMCGKVNYKLCIGDNDGGKSE